MSRGYGNAERYAMQALIVRGTAAQVAATSNAAAAGEAIAAVETNLGTGYDVGGSPATLLEAITDLQTRVEALEP